MALTSTFNNDEVTPLAGSLSLTWRTNGRGTARASYQAPAYLPAIGQELRIFKDASTLWAGTIERIVKRWMGYSGGSSVLRYDVEAVTWEQRLEKRLVRPPASTSEPNNTYVELAGVVDTAGTAVTWVSGDKFDKNLEKTLIRINSVDYLVASVSSVTALTLTTSAGTQNDVAYGWYATCGNVFRSLLWFYGGAGLGAGLDEGITFGTIIDGADVQKITFDHLSVSEAAAQLAEYANHVWYINTLRQACFHPRDEIGAPDYIVVGGESGAVGLLDGWDVLTTREDVTNVHYRRISYSAFEANAAVLGGDDTAKAFWTDHPVALIADATVEESGAFRIPTFGIRGVDTGKDFYWSYGERKISQDASVTKTVSATTDATPIEVTFTAAHGLETGAWAVFSGVGTGVNGGHRVTVIDADTVSLDGSEAPGSTYSSGTMNANQPLATGDYLRFVYRRVGGDIATFSDGADVSARSAVEGTSGRYESFEESTDIDKEYTGNQIAEATVDDRKADTERVTVRILDDGYYPGSLVQIVNSVLGLNDLMLIESLSAVEHEPGASLVYTVEAINTNRTRNAVELFRALQGGGGGGSSIVSVSGGSSVNTPSGTVVGSETAYTITYAGTVTVDASNGQNQFLTLTGNVTLNAPTNTTSKRLTLYLIQDGSGGRTVAFNSAWKIPAGYEIDTTANTYSVIDIRFDGSGVARLACAPATGLPI